MGTVSLPITAALAAEYSGLYDSCEIRAERFAEVDRVADAVVASKSRYQAAAGALGIPWFFVGGIHNLESSLRFDRLSWVLAGRRLRPRPHFWSQCKNTPSQ